MSLGLACTVYVDGQRFADGSPGEAPDDPVALAGLQVVWGRETTVDQPEPSTCTFTAMDERGGRSFLDILRTGQTVDVTATGTLYPDPTEGTFLDPDFTAAPPVILTNATSITDAGIFQLHPKDAARTTTVIFAPAPFEPAGTNPAAWDAIPATSAGQTWRYAIRVQLPPGAAATVRPVLFSGPWANAAAIIDEPLPVASTGGMVDVEGEFEPAVDGAWVGVQLTVYPTGYRWVDVPPEWTWASIDPTWTWLDMDTALVDSVNAFAPAGGTERTVLVFAGRITDVEAGWDDSLAAPAVKVTAQDFTADLANDRVGDEPWAVEAMSDRFNRVLELAGMGVTAQIDDTLTGVRVSYQDVDSQPAADLLRDLAQTVDGIMWSAVHQTTGPYLHVEDPAQRAPLAHLELVDGVVVIVMGSAIGDLALKISACDILRDPVTWTQTVSDITTRASVGWLEQGVDDDGKPETTDRTYTVVDAGAEASFGQRGISVGTMLQAEADAQAVAERLLARTSQIGWRASGLHIDDDTITKQNAASALIMLELLDGTLRNGRPLRLVDLPDWSPVSHDLAVFLEGGTYAYDINAADDDTIWQLDLTVSNAAGTGTSLTWNDVDPTWMWAQVDPEITWLDLYGVGPAPEEALA